MTETVVQSLRSEPAPPFFALALRLRTIAMSSSNPTSRLEVETTSTKDIQTSSPLNSASLSLSTEAYNDAVVTAGVVETSPGKAGEGGPDPTDDANSDEQVEYPNRLRLALIVFGIAMAVFMVFFDMTVISTAIPSITNQFNSLNDIGWYGSAYMLTVSKETLVAR
jgi:hypothetical protein